MGQNLKSQRMYRTAEIYLFDFFSFRNEFLEKSRYAKIAYHVAATMETVNLNEITNDQALAHLVNLRLFIFLSCIVLKSFLLVNFQW